MSTTNVSIIGAGLSGLALALALQQQSNVCTLYEARPATLDIGGALMLTPNALRILDSIGIYARLKDNGYSFDSSTSLPRPQAVDSYEFGGEANKFTRVLEETPYDVIFEFEDETTATATILVGADGDWHQRCHPDLPTQIARAVRPSRDYQDHGAFIITPQQPDRSEVFIGRQKRAPELDREGWAGIMLCQILLVIRTSYRGEDCRFHGPRRCGLPAPHLACSEHYRGSGCSSHTGCVAWTSLPVFNSGVCEAVAKKDLASEFELCRGPGEQCRSGLSVYDGHSGAESWDDGAASYLSRTVCGHGRILYIMAASHLNSS
ncbi:hypothetical protein AN3235.2 [Aspergillus nidulans FGSC A4]|uniref:FAD-binding domain-containing protein n=1 Tax=Emericella nidulans (strain FGSC A4 / ATCC 38163 / CBS 112.46 / NRRL 194 / M139) TaxID=227321 RepID=Q5B895_EMENI|nr:hypothetical protein [Aspergillus nidulans FGSC A4]EAA63136.1 hypothetical protein AN3235.2 [Aspergillus nidulans FGSC A4]CBF83128.1 TPA: conserved hypothetical protein [Aspergillus nidulans FGSC A4]|eukprot:XP_660839.1 hypothetical protein AN3235.2 [Aspergillus nidulans FGSC A4]